MFAAHVRVHEEHVRGRIQAPFYRAMRRCRCSCRARCSAERSSQSFTTSAGTSINSNERVWFVQETASRYGNSSLARATAKYDEFQLPSPRWSWLIQKTGVFRVIKSVCEIVGNISAKWPMNDGQKNGGACRILSCTFFSLMEHSISI